MRKITMVGLMGLVGGCMAAPAPAPVLPMSQTVPVMRIELTKKGQGVTLHPFDMVYKTPGCTRIVSLRYTAGLPYDAALYEVRNRAGALGGNVAAIEGLAESGATTEYVAHFFDCKNKKAL
jgi:hypothetical protein